MRRVVAFIIGVLALLNAYAAECVIGRWPLARHHALSAVLGAVAFFLLQLLGPFGDRLVFRDRRRAAGLAPLVHLADWTSYSALGLLSLLVSYGLLVDLVTLPWRWWFPPPDPLAFDRQALDFLGLAVGITFIVGLWQALIPPSVREVSIPLGALPPGFDGFRIAQVSDLHVGPTIGRARVRTVVETVNRLAPDLVVLTGDCVDGTVRDLAAEVAPLAALRPTQGVYYITGNHEYFWNALEWIAAFRRLGARVLVNEHEVIRHRGDAIVLAGITDYSTRRLGPPHASDPQRALAGAPPGLVRIVLAHQPASYPMTQAAGCDLQLSGHTHAGQYFPFSLLIGYFQRYYKGLNRHGKMWIYVNRGTGYWGPPLRTGVPAEITLITLRRAHD